MNLPLQVTMVSGPLLAAAIFLLIRGASKNPWIKRRLSVSIFLLIAAALLHIVAQFVPEAATNLLILELLLIGVAAVVAVVVLIFNPFRGTRVSDKYPSIVQDAIVIGVFLLVVAYLAPDKFITTSAVGALVIGLALQDTLGNLFSGLAIQVEKPFFVGDWVSIAAQEGRIVEMTWRATKIRTKAGEHCVIPNSVISKDTIVNYSSPSPLQRMEKLIGFGYETHPNTVKRVVTETLGEIDGILKRPQPQVQLVDYSDFSINYLVRYWINDFARLEEIMDNFMTLLYYRMDRAGVRIPFPIRDVRMSERVDHEISAEDRLENRLQLIEKVDLFGALGEEERERIAQTLREARFAHGEAIVRQGEAGDSMFFVRQGVVDVQRQENDKTHTVATLGAGHFFGEMALLTGEERTATIVARTDVSAMVLELEAFRKVVLGKPELAERISEVIAGRRDELHSLRQVEDGNDKGAEVVKRSILRRIQSFLRL